MLNDPFPDPISLAFPRGGPWTYVDPETGAKFQGQNFWIVARQIWLYRKINRKPNPSYEQAQMDLLVAKRKQLGLKTEIQSLPQQPPPQPTSPVTQWIRKVSPKQGCKTCGKH